MNLNDLRELTSKGWFHAILLLALGGPVVVGLGRALARRMSQQGRPHQGMLVYRAITTFGALFLLFSVGQALGVDLTALLATAGVLTVAIGLAAQTSLSNLIAGVFLLVDRPFEIGDTVEIEGRVGVVQAITLLSTHVRTFNNIRVRWPNDVVLKATILNYTRFPARRVDLALRVLVGGDLAATRAAMLDEIEALPLILLDPPPEVLLRGFTDNTVEVEVRAWLAVEDFILGRTALTLAIHEALHRVGAELGPAPARRPPPL